MMDMDILSKKRRISEEQDEEDEVVVEDHKSKAKTTRSITLDMSKYSEDVQELTNSELVKVFEIGLAVKQSFTLKLSENSDLLKEELKPIFDKMEEIQRNIEGSESSILDGIGTFNQELSTIKQQMNKPAKRGSFGESVLTEILKRNFPAFTVSDVSRQAGKGDIHIETPDGLLFLVEVKNHTKSVPKAEIEKFRKDVASSHEVKIGLMFSLNSGIATKCKNEKFQVDFDNNKFLIYVPTALEQEEIIVWCVHLANELAHTSVELKEGQTEKLQKLCEDFQSRVKDVKKCRDKMKVLKDTVDDLAVSMEPLLLEIETAKKKINDIINKK